MAKFLIVSLLLTTVPWRLLGEEKLTVTYRKIEPEDVPLRYPHYYNSIVSCCDANDGDLYNEILASCPKTDDLYCFKGDVEKLTLNAIPGAFNKIWRSLPPDAKNYTLNKCTRDISNLNFSLCLSRLIINQEDLLQALPGLDSQFNEYQLEYLKRLAINLRSYLISASSLMKVCFDQSRTPLTLTQIDTVKENVVMQLLFPLL